MVYGDAGCVRPPVTWEKVNNESDRFESDIDRFLKYNIKTPEKRFDFIQKK